MKGYKTLAPILMIAFFALGVYMLYDANLKEETTYNTYLEAARKYAAEGVEVYANQNYQTALAVRPSLELQLEIGQYYMDSGQVGMALAWGTDVILKSYPKEPIAYEYMIEKYYETNDYVGCFDYYDTVVAKQLSTQRIEEIIKEIKYKYYISSSYEDVGAFSGSYSPVMSNGKWGYSNHVGKKAIATIFSYVGPFYFNVAPVVDLEGNAYYMDAAGNKVYNVLVEEKVEKLGLMENDIYSLYNGEVWNFYHKETGYLCGDFTDASILSGGIFMAQKDGVWSIYTTSGEKYLDASFDDIVRDEKNVASRNERFFVKVDNEYKMIDATGQQYGTTYEDAKLFNDATYAAVKKDGKWGFIDKDGTWFIEPTYDDARSFSNGFAGVKVGLEWGFINLEKEVCIDYLFDDVKDFNANGAVFVNGEGAWSALVLYQMNH